MITEEIKTEIVKRLELLNPEKDYTILEVMLMVIQPKIVIWIFV